MFTGLIESVGRVIAAEGGGAGRRLRIATTLASELVPGDSVAVNGVCLTVTACTGGSMDADIGPETLRVTTLGGIGAGHLVNLERSMRADGRFGGHFVQGHVDGVGTIEEIRSDGEARWLSIAVPPELGPLFIPKGSVAVDGISLTVAGLGDGRIDIMIVPFTWGATNLPARRCGDGVNLECDMIGKYVARALDVRASQVRVP
jgi:riboflavin synthase